MNVIIYPYQANFSNALFQRIFGAVCGLTALSVILGFIFQLTIESICHTKSLIIFLSSLAFWAVAGTWASELSKNQRVKKNSNSALLILGVGVGVLALNQILVRASVNFSLYFFYNCKDEVAGWLPYLFANNIIINLLCYIGFVGFGFWEAKQYNLEVSPNIQSPKNTNEEIEEEHTGEQADSDNQCTYLEKISLKNGSELFWLQVSDIQWIEADNNCITFITSKKKYVSYQTLKSIEEVLDPAQFVRIHRSTIFNKKQIQRMINLPSGDAWVEISRGERLRVSRTYKKNLLA
jgi:hypothetical protein